jgi:hypothetical protein
MLGRTWVSVVLIATLSGCVSASRPKPFLPNTNVPLECATNVHLVDCEPSFSPPYCRIADVTYREGCEQVVVVK